MNFEIGTQPGGKLCKCGHGSDMHDLEEAGLVGVDDYSFIWRMKCRGIWATSAVLGAYAECGCTNFRDGEEMPNAEE